MSAPAPALADFDLPAELADVLRASRGWFVVTGPGDCDEHGVLAAAIDEVNGNRDGRIVTVEKPIRYDIAHRRCVVTQREIGADIKDTPDAYVKGARHAQRIDADVLALDSLAEQGTLDAAMVAADAGLFVLTAARAGGDWVAAFERVLSLLGPGRADSVRACLARQLVAWVHAVPVDGGAETVVVREVLVGTESVRAAIAGGHAELVARTMSAERGAGMRALDDALLVLWRQGRIERGAALERASFPRELADRMDQPT